MYNAWRLAAIAFLMGLLISITACGYDNTMFNAKKYYKAAQNRPLGQNGVPSGQAVEEYNKTITKCGYILTNRPHSAIADDALILLAKALYYKGNNLIQAKEQFESLIRNFPDSPFVSEATLYIARIYRSIKQPDNAENILTAYIGQAATAKWHPQAMLLLADFSIQDSNFDKAKYWLEEVQSKYPNTTYSRQAILLLGKTYYEQKDYNASLKQFQALLGSFRAPKSEKLDARYYIALNLLQLNRLDESLSIIKPLLKSENRAVNSIAVKLLHGRILLRLQKEKQGLALLNSIITLNARTQESAEAYYWLGEYYYYTKHDPVLTLENYNKVSAEFSTSTYAAAAKQKSDALNKIAQKSSMPIVSNHQQYLDTQLEIAANFMDVFNLPDSAAVVYQSIYAIPSVLQNNIDSLQITRQKLELKIDSLNVVLDSLKAANPDSLNVLPDTLSIRTLPDTLSATVPADTLSNLVLPDTLKTTPEIAPAQPDTLSLTNDLKTTIPPDSLSSFITASGDTLGLNQPLSNRSMRGQVSGQVATLTDQITQLDQDIDNIRATQEKFRIEYIPYAMFVQTTLLYKKNPANPDIEQIYQTMQNTYPENIYTNAIGMLLEGKPVRLVDKALEQDEINLDAAFTLIDAAPDSAVVILDSLTHSNYPEIKQKAFFRLGWHYLFEQPDTVKAKTYLHDAIEIDPNSEYSIFTRRFYNGRNITIKLNEPDSLLADQPLADSLLQKMQADTTQLLTPPDSIKAIPEVNSEPDKAFLPPEIKPEQEVNPAPAQPDIIKPEDIKAPEPLKD